MAPAKPKRPRGRPPAGELVPPEVRALAVEAVRGGATTREVGASIGVSHASVAKWVAAAGPVVPPLAPAPLDAPEAPAPRPPEPPRDGADGLAVARWMRASALYDAAQARRAGHHEAAASSMRQATTLVPVIARLEKAASADGDGVRYSRAEIADAFAAMTERFRAFLARPLLCGACGRALSAAWGGVDLAKVTADGQADHSASPGQTRGV